MSVPVPVLITFYVIKICWKFKLHFIKNW
jgi:hypothetical protein